MLDIGFDGAEAVLSVGTSGAGEVTATVQGKLLNGDIFYVQSQVTIKGNLVVKFEKHIVACGARPGSRKEPIRHSPVRVYPKGRSSCAAGKGISWHHYPEIYKTCTDWVAQAGSDDFGITEFVLPPGDYLVIAEYDPDPNPAVSNDELYIGRSVGDFAGDVVRMEYVQVIENCKKDSVPAKYKKLKGSELLIIEPEYVEWSGESELYPFIFESVGTWSVTTAVSPPEGFEADHESLSAEVNSEIQVLQFTITDIGSEWVPTKVKHKIKHKGKRKVLGSEIGVKLSPELAKKKGLGLYGKEIGKKQKDKSKQ